MIRVVDANSEGIEAAIEALGRGLLVLHPTETVVSLTGDPYHEGAADAARRVKGYDTPRPFLCLVADPPAASRLAAHWPEAAERLARAFWPGPLTLVVSAAASAPEPVAVGGTIAVRPASDPASRALLVAWGGPLFSTSANRRGEPAPVRVEEAASALGAGADAEMIALGLRSVDHPPAGEGRPSTIVEVTGRPRLTRPGAIPLERLREIVPDLEEIV